MPDIDLDALERIAKASPEGPWFATFEGRLDGLTTVDDGRVDGDMHPLYAETRLAAHIATFDPPTVLALIERVRRVETALRALITRMDVVHVDPAFKAVWAVGQFHRGSYDGPQYVAELKAARAALEQSNG